MTPIDTQALRAAPPSNNNDALTALHRIWHHEADWMICQGCKRPLIASRDGEELAHSDGCKYAAEQHPWSQLRTLLGAAPKQAKSKAEYPADFESAWEAYPPRAGANKKTAFKAWTARRKAGAAVADLVAGAERYAVYVLAERTEERFIKQPSTFFGPDEHYMLPWRPTRGAPARQSANDEAKRILFGGDHGASDGPR